MVTKIPLTQGMFALVDDEDAEMVNQHKWRAHQEGSAYYAVRTAYKSDGRITNVRMHLALTGFKGVHHINGNGLDNRRSNLRLLTTREKNGHARKCSTATTSIYKGVCKRRKRNRFTAEIRIPSTEGAKEKKKYIGSFISEAEAARAYDAEARKYRGNFTLFNFPLPGERSALTGEIVPFKNTSTLEVIEKSQLMPSTSQQFEEKLALLRASKDLVPEDVISKYAESILREALSASNETALEIAKPEPVKNDPDGVLRPLIGKRIPEPSNSAEESKPKFVEVDKFEENYEAARKKRASYVEASTCPNTLFPLDFLMQKGMDRKLAAKNSRAFGLWVHKEYMRQNARPPMKDYSLNRSVYFIADRWIFEEVWESHKAYFEMKMREAA